MDAECVIYDTLTKAIGNDELRRKGSGQTSILSGVITFVGKNFGDRINIEIVEGIDDIMASRELNERWIRWIDTHRTSSFLQSALWQFITDKYIK